MSIRDIPDDAYAVTPSDTNNLPRLALGLLATGAGQVQLTTMKGTTVVVAVSAGVPLPLRVRRVWATNTTATGLVALTGQ